jgi:hypothetical protein
LPCSGDPAFKRARHARRLDTHIPLARFISPGQLLFSTDRGQVLRHGQGWGGTFGRPKPYDESIHGDKERIMVKFVAIPGTTAFVNPSLVTKVELSNPSPGGAPQTTLYLADRTTVSTGISVKEVINLLEHEQPSHW